MGAGRTQTRRVLTDAIGVAALHAAACGLALALGFDHVSDDDFARITIAQRFAVEPRLDPSGTSWLPFPFWATGAAMMVLGRSLGAARLVGVLSSSAAAALPYVALRTTGVPRRRALFAVAFALASAWSLWLGAATTPEAMTASASAAAAIALAAPLPAASLAPWAAVLAMACLSRYEPWPLAAVLACALALRGLRQRSLAIVAVSVICALGPLLWMAWNALAHDGPLHSFRRVSGFKRAIGEGATDPVAALLLYPRLLFSTRPDVVIGAAAALALVRRADARTRWRVPLLAAVAELAFLAYGNARDGAPAHHPERALLGVTMLAALFAADALAGGIGRGRRLVTLATASALFAAWIVSIRPLFGPPPGSSPAEDRRAQIARGRELRGAARLVVSPCAYEHFAVLAAFEAPERAEIHAPSNAPITPSCPLVERRDTP